ncbi:hypothetical protein DKZ27_04245 [Limosilactobacillus reuteri]|uniref:hypothetical protein n=1 Tax=Limosilactobacillus reuteri TaxID=1598 RepID=UPI000D6EBF98|nr:hypothetical protein [Limosilactobacillus reuteri]PWT30898.1 hypothetical protein DKZ27_04245 [Limosilactobacillus reuteri]
MNEDPNKNNSTMSILDWIRVIGFILFIILLFSYIYDNEADHNLTFAIGAMFVYILCAYYLDYKGWLSRPLSKFLTTIKPFISSPIFIVGMWSIIILLFLAGVIHFPDII